ncbi:MAG: hypothetical protein P4L46_03110 [Fimbriimonas sp.]|nr:hypothetical protein [Fimbriimonas sp.]
MIGVLAAVCLASPASGTWRLNDGSNVSVFLVRPAQGVAWRPNGALVPARSIQNDLPHVLPRSSIGTMLVAVIEPPRIDGFAPTIQFKLQPSHKLGQSSSAPMGQFSSIGQDGRSFVCANFSLDPETPIQPISVGIASGSWQKLGSVEYGTSQSGRPTWGRHGIHFDLDVQDNKQLPTRTKAKRPETVMTMQIPRGLRGQDVRLVAIDKSGRTYLPGAVSQPDLSHTQFTCEGDWRNIARVELQTRRFEWVEIKQAHLRPN